MASAKTRQGRRREAPKPDAGADDVLCYADQGSFIGLRALERGPVVHVTWLYSHTLDEAAVNAFNERVAQGFLGRVLRRSPLPWGRHRWVSSPVPAPVTWFTDPTPVERLPEWRSALVDLPVDPERGPGWRLAVQLLDGGGCALSILVSHTIADGGATIQAIVDAVAGRRLDRAFPAASWRWSPAMMVRDSVESVRALPGVWRALVNLARRSRSVGATGSGPRQGSGSGSGGHAAPELAAAVPIVQLIMDAKACEERASDLGVTSNTLLAAFAVRLAFRMGRVDADGRVKLVLPVSDRRPGDRRGNALQAVTVMADPDALGSNPRALQREVKSALAALRRHGDDLTPLFPLLPYVPLWLARHVDDLSLWADLPVACSLYGELPPELNRPCGEASLVQVSPLERYTARMLARLGGLLHFAFYRIDARVLVTVSGYAPDRVTTRAELAPLVRDALTDLGLQATIS